MCVVCEVNAMRFVCLPVIFVCVFACHFCVCVFACHFRVCLPIIFVFACHFRVYVQMIYVCTLLM